MEHFIQQLFQGENLLLFTPTIKKDCVLCARRLPSAAQKCNAFLLMEQLGIQMEMQDFATLFQNTLENPKLVQYDEDNLDEKLLLLRLKYQLGTLVARIGVFSLRMLAQGIQEEVCSFIQQLVGTLYKLTTQDCKRTKSMNQPTKKMNQSPKEIKDTGNTEDTVFTESTGEEQEKTIGSKEKLQLENQQQQQQQQQHPHHHQVGVQKRKRKLLGPNLLGGVRPPPGRRGKGAQLNVD